MIKFYIIVVFSITIMPLGQGKNIYNKKNLFLTTDVGTEITESNEIENLQSTSFLPENEEQSERHSTIIPTLLEDISINESNTLKLISISTETQSRQSATNIPLANGDGKPGMRQFSLKLRRSSPSQLPITNKDNQENQPSITTSSIPRQYEVENVESSTLLQDEQCDTCCELHESPPNCTECCSEVPHPVIAHLPVHVLKSL